MPISRIPSLRARVWPGCDCSARVRQRWSGGLTDDELEQTKGDITAIGGLVQQKYGESKADYERKFEGIYRDLEAKKDSKMLAEENN